MELHAAVLFPIDLREPKLARSSIYRSLRSFKLRGSQVRFAQGVCWLSVPEAPLHVLLKLSTLALSYFYLINFKIFFLIRYPARQPSAFSLDVMVLVLFLCFSFIKNSTTSTPLLSLAASDSVLSK